MNRFFGALIGLLALSGCKTLVPYDSEFSCQANQDFGRCMNVQEAYDDALGTAADTEKRDKTGKAAPKWDYRNSGSSRGAQGTSTLQRRKPGTNGKGKATLITVNSADLYRESRYRELAGLIEETVTPIVQAPKVLRTLIVSYSANDTLYMPRYVYFLADEAKFVLGDYLKGDPTPKVVYPNSAPLAKSDSKR
jgi:conjugal transfer pilus assembly protein TraV